MVEIVPCTADGCGYESQYNLSTSLRCSFHAELFSALGDIIMIFVLCHCSSLDWL